MVIIYVEGLQTSTFVTVGYFHPGLIFVRKARRLYMNGPHLRDSAYETRVEVTISDKRISLRYNSINCSLKV
jgi:hypothetical protein